MDSQEAIDDDALYILPPTHTHARLGPSSSSIVT